MRTKGNRKSFRIRSKVTTPEIHNNWEISYGDMVTLLLGFFVIFFNVKNDPLNVQILLNQFKTEIKAQPYEEPTGPKAENVLKVFNPNDKNTAFPHQAGNKLIIEFPGVSFFEAGGIDLTIEGKKALETFAKKAQNFTGQFRYVIRGYTDNKPPGSHPLYKDNLELSAFRSISAIRYLKQSGLKLSDMRIGGYGETDHTERVLPPEVRKLDRKIVIVIEPLDHTERTQTLQSQNSRKTYCDIDPQLTQGISCLAGYNLLPQEFQWMEPKYRKPASIKKTNSIPVEKNDWIHNNFLYRYLNDYHDRREDGGTP